MSTPSQSALTPMLRKLQLWEELDSEDQNAVLSLPHRLMELEPGEFIVREGDEAVNSCLLISGLAYRHKIAGDGGRSINAVHMEGDLVDLQNALLDHADHSVQALTRAKIAYISRDAITQLAFSRPSVGLAMWRDTLVDGSIFREWILNIARREGPTRIAHVLCEFGVRLEALGLGNRSSYQFPMTQDQLADVTGLTNVHVNRSLKDLEARGLITRTRRYIEVGDWAALQEAGDFDAAYLHLPRSEASGPYVDARL